MDPNPEPRNYDLHIEDGMWKLSLDQARPAPALPDPQAVSTPDPGFMWIGTATGPKALTREEAIEIVRNLFWRSAGAGEAMTVADFVETRFIPVYLASRSPSTRINYRSILKLIIDPDRVDLAFNSEPAQDAKRSRFRSGWPYLSHLRLNDVRSATVQNLIDTAIRSGYSMHTVAQVRNAVCMIFAFASRENCFSARNPVRLLEWPSARRRISSGRLSLKHPALWPLNSGSATETRLLVGAETGERSTNVILD